MRISILCYLKNLRIALRLKKARVGEIVDRTTKGSFGMPAAISRFFELLCCIVAPLASSAKLRFDAFPVLGRYGDHAEIMTCSADNLKYGSDL